MSGQWAAGVGDQRHAGTIDLSWHPLDGSWRFTTTTFTGHSGWPYTTTVVRVDTVSRTATTTTLGAYIASGSFNDATLPFYSRFDVRWMRFIHTAHWHGSVFAEVFNIFNADNPRGYYDSVRFDGRGGYTLRSVPNSAIPRLPAIGLSWDF